MSPGTTQRVLAGDAMIHGFSYLQAGGLTLSIRSKALAEHSTVEYLRSGLALDGAVSTPAQETLVKTLRYLKASDPSAFIRGLHDVVERSNLLTCFQILREHAMPCMG